MNIFVNIFVNLFVNLFVNIFVNILVNIFVVGTMEGGFEVISNEDMIAKLEGVNYHMKDWMTSHAWEGVREGNFVSCSTCPLTDKVWEQGEYNECRCNNNKKGNNKYRIESDLLRRLNLLKGAQYEENMELRNSVIKGTEPELMEYRGEYRMMLASR